MDAEQDTGLTTTRGRTMTAEGRRNRGPASSGASGRPEVRRGRPRVAGQRAAERRREAAPPPPAPPGRRGFALPSLPSVRLPRSRLPRLPRRPPTAASPTPTAVLAVLVLLAAVGVGYLAVSLRDADASEAAAETGQVTAARYAEQLLSYDYAHLDKDFSQAQRLLTDDFRREYIQATDVVRDEAVQDKAVIKASVVATSVVSAEPDEVRTLLFVNQTTTTGRGGTPSIDLNRVVVTLVHQHGRWLVGDLDAL
jgi:Mce-associated membrane protein